MSKNMTWTTLNFGKYIGKTLPQIVLLDPDWFFWVLPRLYGTLAEEAQALDRRAKAIKIPGPDQETLVVEYQYDNGTRFLGFCFVQANSSVNTKWCRRRRYLDLSIVRSIRSHDKLAGRRLVRDFRRNYFGQSKRLTKERCEAFFSNDENFVNP
jgi:hypothetical protein